LSDQDSSSSSDSSGWDSDSRIKGKILEIRKDGAFLGAKEEKKDQKKQAD